MLPDFFCGKMKIHPSLHFGRQIIEKVVNNCVFLWNKKNVCSGMNVCDYVCVCTLNLQLSWESECCVNGNSAI